jgi:4-hydroxyacetophenone monooxygenase
MATSQDSGAMTRAAAAVDLPPLLAAMADYFGDRRFLDERFRPQPPRVGLVVSADGALPAEAQTDARALIAEVLAGGVPAQRVGSIEPHEILAFLTGAGESPFAQRLDREVGVVPTVSTDQLSGSRFAIIGGGLSGICAAVTLSEMGADYRLFEKEAELGGTWFLNAYPGCRLDTSNFAYSYSFAQKADWDHKYSPREEILGYLQDVADRYSVGARALTGVVVEECVWSEVDCEWQVTWRDSTGERMSDRYDFVVSAVGQLNHPKVPRFEGLEGFEGETVHSADWTADVDVRGKSVGLIGTGASGFQIVPEIVDDVRDLTVFVRNPPWMLPEPAYEDELAPDLKALFRGLPTYATWFRFWMFWAATEGRLPYAVIDPDWTDPDTVSELNRSLRDDLLAHLSSQYTDRPDLLEVMTPHYPPGAKRMPRDSGRWARAVKDPKVTVETSPIERFTAGGIETADGAEHPLDFVVLATGFEADRYLADIHVSGVGGQALTDYWAGRPRAFLGITVPGFPNFFMLYGPNVNLVVNGSLVFLIESALDYITALVAQMREAGAQAVDTTEEALQSFLSQVDAGNAQRAWGLDSVTNWYKNEAGVVTQNWPFGLSEYWSLTREPSPGSHVFRG